MGNGWKMEGFTVTGENKQQNTQLLIKEGCERVRLEGAKGERDV